MTKDEALKMAIDYLGGSYEAHKVRKACQEALDTPECNPHPKAPHGFCRNASHSAGRYVCECEGWELEWQGLSDDEQSIIFKNQLGHDCSCDPYSFYLAIEQALRNKNGY